MADGEHERPGREAGNDPLPAELGAGELLGARQWMELARLPQGHHGGTSASAVSIPPRPGGDPLMCNVGAERGKDEPGIPPEHQALSACHLQQTYAAASLTQADSAAAEARVREAPRFVRDDGFSSSPGKAHDR